MQTCSVKGFRFAGIEAGLKKKGGKDLGLIFSQVPASTAAVFTRNAVKAAPVLLDQERVRSGSCQAVIVNSGNANCCTGDKGMEDALTMARLAAKRLGIDEELVLVASTGVIGADFPIGKIAGQVPLLVDSLGGDSLPDFARAIMTTDTVPKMISAWGEIGKTPYTIAGAAKGAGMICPDMATMLGFVVTDLGVPASDLQKALGAAVENSFNRITIDGDTSTNDTVILMANGVSGAVVREAADLEKFQSLLNSVMLDLARMVVQDGEGATKLVEVRVKGARDAGDARRVAAAVANSNLVKTALFGEDANWGRILAAAGRSGAALDPGRVDIYFDDVGMVRGGQGAGAEVEAAATRVLKKPEFTITLDLKMGTGSASMLTCDFSIDYVKINADYRS